MLNRQHPKAQCDSNCHRRRSVQLQRGDPEQRHRTDRVVAPVVVRRGRSAGLSAQLRPVLANCRWLKCREWGYFSGSLLALAAMHLLPAYARIDLCGLLW